MSKDFIITMGVIVAGVLALNIYTSNLAIPVGHARVRTTNDVNALQRAIDGYYSEYGCLPKIGAPVADTEGPVGVTLLTVILGTEPIGTDMQNPKQIAFLSAKVNRTKTRGGLVYKSGGQNGEPEGFYDFWGEPFHVVLDDDYNREIADPLSPGKVIRGKNVIVFSYGPDKKPGGDDDIKSW